MGGGGSKQREAEAELARQQAANAALLARLEAIEAKERAAQQAAKEAAEADFVTTTVVPATSQALLGSTLGGAAGYTLKVVGRVAAVGVGSGFILLQTLSYLGYVQVDWRKVERDTTAKLDRDGDGEVTTKDFLEVWKDVESVLAFNLPAGAGFTAGLLWGLGLSAGKASGAAAVAGLGARIALPRVALGGATATGLPAAVIAAKRTLSGEEEAPHPGTEPPAALIK